MLEGIGLMTILGTLSTGVIGYTTPLDCYIGLGVNGSSSHIHIEDPTGVLGCQYDVDRVRFFVEHLSSPSTGSDHPGVNHAGIKYVTSFGAYAGVSIGMDSDQMTGDNPYVMGGFETGGSNVKIYTEYLTSINDIEGGLVHGGVKFIF